MKNTYFQQLIRIYQRRALFAPLLPGIMRSKKSAPPRANYSRAWINDFTMRTQGMHGISTACRIVEDTLETSHGASVPVADVIASGIWQAVQNCRADEVEFAAPDMTIGYYRGVKIDTLGNVCIGCHSFKYAEVARIVGLLGLAILMKEV